ELSAYRLTKGGVQFPWDTRFPQRLVRQLIEKRITENLQAERENTAKKVIAFIVKQQSWKNAFQLRKLRQTFGLTIKPKMPLGFTPQLSKTLKLGESPGTLKTALSFTENRKVR